MEVLAAFKHNKEDILELYVEKLLATGEPVHIARALAVAGYSDESCFATQTLAQFDKARGFVGGAHRAARAAYDRNRWSRHWYGLLQSATTRLDFWRYSVLLSKIVDGRFDLWGLVGLTIGPFKVFCPTIEGEIKQRINKWNDERKDRLFGDKLPHVVFLVRRDLKN